MTQQNIRKGGSESNLPPQMPKQDKSLRWQQPQEQKDAIQNNIQVVSKLFDFFNRDDLTQLNMCDELYTTDAKLHDPSAPQFTSGVSAMKQAENEYVKAFPNKKVKVESMFADSDKVVVRWTCRATHKGEFRGVAPTNKNVTISGISIYRLANGKIAEIWQNWDLFGLLKQIK